MYGCKKVAAIHDLSGLGRCSLSVIIPVLSAMGVQVCAVPTAVLSAHTGYGDFVMRDLTGFISPALEHYKEIQTDFECIYSGFLASEEQIEHCLEFFSSFPRSLKVVDPVMGDNGKRYRTYTRELCDGIRQLVAVADVITPNLTEASILLSEEYPVVPLTREKAKSWLVRLSGEGTQIVVITSVPLEEGGIATIGYDRESNSFWKIKNDYVPVSYPGTGDMFASVLTGSLLKGDSLPIAMNRATAFTELTVKTTYGYQTPPEEGLMFEGQLPWLTGYQELKDYTNL